MSIDGVDVRDLAADVLAGTAALVAQVPFVFDDTVRANVSLDRPGVDDEASGPRCGWPRPTGSSPPCPTPRLLVLDDATSAVDPRVEAAILAGLRSSAGGGPGASILVVAYRRATIALADEVIYLEHGRVVARGTHSTLLATVPGYADLVTAYEQAEVDHQDRQHTYDEVTPMTSGLEVDR